MIVPGWHPIAVHFPLALIVTAACLFGVVRFVPNPKHAAVLALVGTWNLCLGAIASLAALATGLAATSDLHVGAAARQSIATHVKWAVFTVLALLLLAVWRGAGNAPESKPSWLQIGVLLTVTAALIATGYHGGQNVYHFGIGVSGDIGGR